jgi:hypothetical protein
MFRILCQFLLNRVPHRFCLGGEWLGMDHKMKRFRLQHGAKHYGIRERNFSCELVWISEENENESPAVSHGISTNSCIKAEES